NKVFMDHRISQGITGLEERSFLLPNEIVNEFITLSIERCEKSHVGFPNIVEKTIGNVTKVYAECPGLFSACTLYLIAKKLRLQYNLLTQYDTIFNDEGMFNHEGFDPWRVDYENQQELLLIETIFDEDIHHLSDDFRPFLHEKVINGSFTKDSDIMKLYNGSILATKRQAYSAAILFR
ncbi:hypothetical protein LMH73_026370, partial [Vibrio splendidus]